MLSFGTDGLRGDTRRDLTEGLIAALGRAAAEVLGADRLAIGRDPRASGPALARALGRGVAQAGGVAVHLGVLPTPAVARWCDDRDCAGAMVSASHNPWHDNGVKLFAPGGRKLNDAAQNEIEQRLQALMEGARAGAGRPSSETGPASPGTSTATPPGGRSQQGHRVPSLPSPDEVPDDVLEAEPDRLNTAANTVTDVLGDVPEAEPARLRHLDAVVAGIEGRSLAGMRLVVDCANGAASVSGPECLRRLGADVETIHASPDGRNINRGCGSLHPGVLQAEVVASGADAGIAFDGDADRVVAVDRRGRLVDGDQILAACAIDRARRGLLTGGAVVLTVMANLGLRRAMEAHRIGVVETAVGDRHVLDALEGRGLALGGEQSGHLIFRDLATTGDGLLTAVQLLDTVKRSGADLGEVAGAAMTKMPQVLIDVPVGRAAAAEGLGARLGPITAAAAERLGARGRALVRPSGTEPVIRVMVEADDEATVRAEAERLSASVAEALS